MKSSLAFLSFFLSCFLSSPLLFAQSKDEPLATEQKTLPEGVSESWFSKVQKYIEKSEYNISWNPEKQSYSSPNRSQNFRINYHEKGFSLTPRETEDGAWNINFTLDSIRQDTHAYPLEKATQKIHNENHLVLDYGKVEVEYLNDQSGMRQNFLIKEPLLAGAETAKELTIFLNVETTLTSVLQGNNSVVFQEHSENAPTQNRVCYKDLKAWSADKTPLPAHMELQGNRLALKIAIENASYPLFIDPLSTTENWTAESNQADAYFGYSVSSAGDVNGDGFSDVIVGAKDFDSEGSVSFPEGSVFVYHGSSSGLSLTPNWTAESNNGGSGFGISVSSAGDVNGDGFSDVIIGAIFYDGPITIEGNEGAAFVYYGSPSGLSTASPVGGSPSPLPDWTAESNQANAEFGYSVSSAGDVNGDGFSDVIIGARSYDNGQSDEGAAFVYYGSAGGLLNTPPVGASPSPLPNWTAESNQVSAEFGYSVSSAGDVNGDGFSDVIIGARFYDNGQSDEGAAFVYHGSAGGLLNTPPVGASPSPLPTWTAESNQVSAEFGWSVSSAGDVNGDGFSDVLIGAYRYNNGQSNEGAAFVYHGSAGGLLNTPPVGASPSPLPNWTAESNQVFAQFGWSVSSAGDVNGDGFSDVLIGAFLYDNGQSDEGAAFVYYGSAGGLLNTPPVGASPSPLPNWTAESNQADAQFGYSVSSAGDVNGDGFSDVLIGARLYDNGQPEEGKAYVYHGSSSGLSLTSAWTGESNQADAEFGVSVSSAGDVNGDGFSDVLVGAPYFDNGQTDEGRAYVYHGSSSGLSLTPDWTTELDQANAEFGYSVSSAGDVNGDGFSDVIVGAYRFDNGQTNEGRAYLYHGSSSGLSPAENWTAESNQADAEFGWSVSSAGDVNGDGYSDVIIGAFFYDGLITMQSDEGAVFVYYGSPSGLSTAPPIGGSPSPLPNWTAESDQADARFGWSVSSAGDVNGDGFSDVLVGAIYFDSGETNEGRASLYHGSSLGLSPTPNWTAESDQVAAEFGSAVSSAGDVNGDGFSDVLIGARFFDNGQMDEGRAYVYHGSSSGLSLFENWTAEPDQANTTLGVSNAGDVNGDGFSDVIVGASGFDNGQTNEGRAYLYHGSSSGLSPTHSWTAESDQAHASFGAIVSSAGDVNGDGFSDVLVGAHLFDNGESNEGRVYVYYGNDGGGLRATPAQYQPGSSVRMEAGAASTLSGEVALALEAKSFLGRQKGRLVWEYVPAGTPFSGFPLTNSTDFSGKQALLTDLGTLGVELVEDITGITPVSQDYKWRVRVEYDPVTAITGQVYGPWKYYHNLNPEVPALGFKPSPCGIDLTVPLITCPSDVTQDTDLGLCSANITIPAPITSDNCGVASVINDYNSTADASDSYPLGTTMVWWLVTDLNGNMSSCVQMVTVEDNEAPVITCPADITLEVNAGSCIATGSIGTASAVDNCDPSPMISSDAPGTFPEGVTVVTWTATDASSNSAQCTQTVTVEDTTAPSITCSGNITQTNPSVTVPSPSVSDFCGIATLVNDFNGTSNASGTYPLGATVVTWTATDTNGNSSSCMQTITITTSGGGDPLPLDPQVEVSTTPSTSTGSVAWDLHDTGSCGAIIDYYIYVGQSRGNYNYMRVGPLSVGSLGGGTSFSYPLSGLPTNGTTVWLRLWYKTASCNWKFSDTSFTAELALPPSPMILSPVAPGPLTGSSALVTWFGGTATTFYLYVGSSVGQTNYYRSPALLGTTTTHTIQNLPANGSTVYVRFWYRIGNVWYPSDLTYISN
jgi:hypothetical protein